MNKRGDVVSTYKEYFRRNYETAKYWVSKGFKVFPTIGFGKDYKAPIPGCKWGEEATNDLVRVDHWWYNTNGYSVSLSLKQANYIVIDCDVKNDVNGVANFRQLLTNNNTDQTKIFQSKTPSGGRHYYFKLPPTCNHLSNSTGMLPDNVEVRGNSSCIMARGTVTREGLSYDNDQNSDLDILDTMELPKWLISIINGNKFEASADTARTNIIPSDYAKAVINNEISNVLSSREGSRNNVLNRAAFCIGTLVPSGSCDQDEVQQLLLKAASSIGLDDLEALTTISSGLSKGMERPRTIPDVSDEVKNFNIEVKRSNCEDFFEIEPSSIDSPLFNTVLRYAANRSFFKHPDLAMGATLSLFSTLMAREVFTPTRMNVGLYALLISETGSGKDDYLKFPKWVLEKLNLDHLLGESNLSSAVHIEKIFADQLISLHTIDEFNTFLKKISCPKSSIIEQEIGMLLKSLWSLKYDNVHKTKGSAARESEKYLCPILNIFGASTPRAFFSSINRESFFDGLINRFVFFHTRGVNVKERFFDDTIPLAIPDRMKRGLKKIYNLTEDSKSKINEIPCRPIIVPWDNEEARMTFRSFFYELLDLEGEERDLFVRLADLSIRIATIIAVSRDFADARITISDMKNGIGIAKSSGNYLYWGKANFISENIVERHSKKVIGIISSAGKKGISRSDLTRKTQMIKKRQRDEIIVDLLESGLITAVEPEDKKSALIYKSIKYHRPKKEP